MTSTSVFSAENTLSNISPLINSSSQPTPSSQLRSQTPILLIPRGTNKPTSNQQINTRKHLSILIPTSLHLDQLSSDWRSRQHRKTHNRERHAHPRARHPQIGCETAESSREEALDSGGDDAVYDGPGVEAAAGRDGDPGEGEDGGEETDGRECVEGAAVAVC